MNKNNIITFGAGLLTGSAISAGGFYLYFRKALKKIQETADDQVKQLEEYYGRTDEYAREESFPDYEEDTLKSAQNGRESGILSNEERRDLKEQQRKLRENWEGTTNYAKMYQNKERDLVPLSDILIKGGVIEIEDPAELEHPEEAKDEQKTEEQIYHEEHQKNKNKKPKIISVEDAADLPAYIEEQTLYYYTEDGALVDDNEEEIEDPAVLIGDALEKYGFADNDERIIFVMNYAQDVCYEVQKVNAAWDGGE